MQLTKKQYDKLMGILSDDNLPVDEWYIKIRRFFTEANIAGFTLTNESSMDEALKLFVRFLPVFQNNEYEVIE